MDTLLLYTLEGVSKYLRQKDFRPRTILLDLKRILVDLSYLRNLTWNNLETKGKRFIFTSVENRRA